MPAGGLRLGLLVALTMTAFAANSVLTRAALATDGIDAPGFAVIRLVSGALVLGLIVLARDRRLPLVRGRIFVGALALFAYMFGFSIAYQWLDAGTGALILFGGVQVTMFAGALIGGEAVPGRRWLGAVLALAGLAWLVAPRGIAPPDPLGAAVMTVAAIGWGIFSLLGRSAGAALPVMAASFFWTSCLGLVAVALLLVSPEAMPVDPLALGLAVASGAITSGLFYALWYAILPDLGSSRAAVAQLTVPALAALGGILVLGEVPAASFLPASALILGGVALSLRR
jgi:drug/metabolite transporter (DMT)-like permease